MITTTAAVMSKASSVFAAPWARAGRTRTGGPVQLLLLACVSVLAACGGGGGGQSPSPPSGPGTVTLAGVVRGGQSAVAGSTVTLFGAGGTAGGGASAIGSAKTDGNGAFSIALNCNTAPLTPASPLYVSAVGGNAGGGTNPAIALQSALGQCQNLPASVTVNGLSTAASAYALNAFEGSSGIGGKSPGLANAFATVASLVDAATGNPAASLPAAAACSGASPPVNCFAVERLNALANAVASCVEGAAGGAAQCAALFDCAAPGATFDGGTGLCTAPRGATLPSDTLQAVLDVARNPGTVAVAGVYHLASLATTFQPAPASAPSDWTLSLNYTGGGLSEPTQAAIDAAGNVWLADYNNAVSEFGPTGAALSPTGGFTGGGLRESFGIAIDANGNVWVTDEESASSVNSAHGSITELGPKGAPLSGANGYSSAGVYFPEAVAVDGLGNIWVADYGDSNLSELQGSSSQNPGGSKSPSPGYSGGGLSFPLGIAIDGSGTVWLADNGANQVSAFSSTGIPLSPPAGYTGGGLDVPQALAIDQGGNVWVANLFGNSVTELSPTGLPVRATAVSGGGLAAPGGVAIDGAGHVWLTNYDGATLSEFTGGTGADPGAALSPASGFSGAGLARPFSPAIDSAGNLWTGNFGNDSVTEFIGVAAPVKTPLIGLPQSP